MLSYQGIEDFFSCSSMPRNRELMLSLIHIYLNSILASNQDEIYAERKKADAKDHSQMGYLRGSSYYGGGRDDQ